MKSTIVSCLVITLFSFNVSISDAGSTGCEISCFFECMFVASPCKTDDCPCPEESSTGNSTVATETGATSSVTNKTEKTGTSAEPAVGSSNGTEKPSFTLDTLKGYLSGGSSTNGSTGNGSSFDYSQYTANTGNSKGSGGQNGSTVGSGGNASNETGSSSGGYDYSAYNTEPETIPTNPTVGFDYGNYYQAPKTIPKKGQGTGSGTGMGAGPGAA